MIKNQRSLLYCLCWIICIGMSCSACSNNKSYNSSIIQCDEVILAAQFPKEYTLNDCKLTGVESFAAFDLDIIDSLMIVRKSQEPFYQIFSLPSLNSKGAFILKGKGPNELIIPPAVINKYYVGNDVVVEFYDSPKNTMMQFNVSRSISEGKIEMNSCKRVPTKSVQTYFVNDSIEFISDFDYVQNRTIRSVNLNNHIDEIKSTKKLNSPNVSSLDNISILSTHIALNRQRLLVAEASLYFNTIHIYSLVDSTISKTISFSDNLKTVEQIERLPKRDRTKYYGLIQPYDSFFAVLLVKKIKSTTDRAMPSLQFFSWDGDPLVNLQLNDICDSFDIDFTNSIIYTLNTDSERIVSYDISHIKELTV